MGREYVMKMHSLGEKNRSGYVRKRSIMRVIADYGKKSCQCVNGRLKLVEFCGSWSLHNDWYELMTTKGFVESTKGVN